MGDSEIRVLLDDDGKDWHYAVHYDGLHVCAGTAVSLPSALRYARRRAAENGYKFGRLRCIGETHHINGNHVVYGADITL